MVEQEVAVKEEKELMNEIKAQCGDCEAWSGTDCTRNPYTQGCLKEEKKYPLRALKAKDVFAISRIISKIGVANFKRCFESDEVKQLVKKVQAGDNEGESVEAVGMAVFLEIADVLFANLPNCERELFTFLADLLGMKVAEAEAIPPADFFDIVVEVVRKPDFADFFKRALRLFK